MVNIVLAIMMQDPLHVGKKLDNLLLSTIKWCYGVNTCKQKILLVFEKFNKDWHGLLEEDFNVKDK